MNQLQKITADISQMTLKIKEEHPELYKHLQENPVTIPDGDDESIRVKHLTDYLKSLHQMLDQFIENQS